MDISFDIRWVALILLLLRFVSLTFIFLVVRKQWRLLTIERNPKLRTLRKVLLGLGSVIMLGQFVPIAIDSVALLGPAYQSKPTLLIFYALSNAITAALSSILLWLVYRVTDRLNLEIKHRQASEDNGVLK